jgi:hypothetical protein
MFLQWLYSPLPWSVLARARTSYSVNDALTITAKQDRDETDTSVKFDACTDESLSCRERATFEAQFRRDVASVRAWFVRENWMPRLLPELRVYVSADYKISRALVPAWDGRQGQIEFPAGRAVAGKAAIAHELIHVYFPNGNRFLAEGLAIYLQTILGGNPAFPNFGRPLHDLARDRLREMVPTFLPGDIASLEAIQLAELDAIPTPNPLTLRAARRSYEGEQRLQAGVYAIAGSFLQFLIEAHGLEKFRKLYMCTPLLVGRLNAGLPERWLDAYGHSLADLEAEWKSLIAAARPHGAMRG